MAHQPPPWALELLKGSPRAAVTPGRIQANKGYSPEVASKIANALFHPAIETGLHLLNGDLYSAHFLARKMQNDQYGMWLHGILHRYEGDLSNTKAWIKSTEESVLSTYPPFKDGKAAAYLLVDRVGLVIRELDVDTLLKQYKEREVPAPPAPTREDLEKISQSTSAEDVDRECWQELTWLVRQLGEQYGWEQNVDGTQGYTESTEEQKAISRRMVGGGEGIRKF